MTLFGSKKTIKLKIHRTRLLSHMFLNLIMRKNGKKFEKQLIDLVKILNKLNKSVIFKLHPIKNSKYYRVILSKYAKFKWYESKKNLIEITQNCLCLITHPYSAAGFDSY